jgi:NuA3 HAT complex component NTO1
MAGLVSPAAHTLEPIESELAKQVEYDMDEQGTWAQSAQPDAVDQAWVDAINAERKKDQSGPITYETFEVVMDKLEKEWFNLVCPCQAQSYGS